MKDVRLCLAPLTEPRQTGAAASLANGCRLLLQPRPRAAPLALLLRRHDGHESRRLLIFGGLLHKLLLQTRKPSVKLSRPRGSL